MGAWGPGPFDNDQAMDLLLEYEDEGVGVLHEWLSDEEWEEDYLDSDLCVAAIAAGEILAACHGHPLSAAPTDFPMGTTPDALAQKLTSHKDVVVADEKLRSLVLSRVTNDLVDPKKSELADLWAEADDESTAAFISLTTDLQARLQRISA